MKTPILIGGFALAVLPAWAQLQPIPADSIRTILLQEVAISTKRHNHQQHLQEFYTANKAATTEELLSRMPEVSFIRRGSYGMEPTIRAYSASQVSVTLDGMRIQGACTDKMDPATIYIEPLNLQSIEVQTAGGSAMQGAAIGGSLNMKLAEAELADEPRLSGAVSTGYQSAANAVLGGLRLNYATPTWGLRASGTYRNAQSYRNGNSEKVLYSQYEKANIAINGKYLLQEDLILKADFIADDGWNIGFPALPMDVGTAKARIGSISLVRENEEKRWTRLEARLYANRIAHSMDDSARPDLPVRMDMPGLSRTSGFYVEGTTAPGANQQLSVRADASASYLEASMTMYQEGQAPMFMLTWPNNRQLQSGVAAQYSWQVNTKTQLQLNSRLNVSDFSVTSSEGRDQMAVFGSTGTERQFVIPAATVQLSRMVYKKLKASISGGINGRTPTASELYGFYLFSQFDGYDYVGNPDLKPERSMQGEFTLSWQEPRVRVQATTYASRVENYIVGAHKPELSAMTMGARGVKVYYNAPYALLMGAEASAVYNINGYTQLVSTLKYSYGRDAAGEPLPMIAPLRHVSSLRKYFGDNLWVQGETEIAAAQHRNSESFGEQPTDAFMLWHLRAGYQKETARKVWQLNAGVENIFNVNYREHLDWGQITRPGRNMFVQLSMSF
ncbi:TonB-dependent receptor [Pontibacter chinhatensis]|uniref:Iron complex outermembrane recepter protein n=1 Tax=Pontibacter chinhatensis TaxID=1436961 RepID=A0A1I2PGQ6_9BACT|nr:TonB-dependent receptor [Pontibacter chinhatensis]SFG14643.1 iron complex outermembrane recepter protein [Pontibacter chinhatensis]